MTVRASLEELTQRFANAGFESPSIESRFLVQSALGLSWSGVLQASNRALTAAEAKRLAYYAGRRQEGHPLAYITESQPFCELDLYVSPAVLIPRPETELLVEKVRQSLDQAAGPQTILDVGTGSGAIALALCVHRNVERVVGIDISPEALLVAQRNAQCHDRGQRCQWQQGNLLDGWTGTIDLIVANLPYVESAVIASLSPEVRREPGLALDGGADGLVLIARLIAQAEDKLRAGGELWLEVGHDQSARVLAALGTHIWAEARAYADLSGIQRFVRGRKKEGSWMS